MSKKSALLDIFWKLSDPKDTARIEAASAILTTLTSQTKENVPEENGEIKTEAATPNLEENVPEENGEIKTEAATSLKYCLDRLIRGLASTRQTSLQGFFICLVELLRQHSKDNEEVSIDKVCQIISKTLHIKGLKSEEGEYMRGKILCYGAIIRSGQANAVQLGDILQKIITLSAKRSYLAIPGYKIIIEGLQQLNEEDFLEHVWPRMGPSFKAKAMSLELIWLLLEIQTKFPNVFNKERTKEVFERKKLIGQEFIKDVADLLMEGNGTVGLRVLAKLPAMPKFLAEIEKEGLLETFWLKQIEPRALKTSPYKASMAVMILNAIVYNIKDVSKLPKFFTENMIDIYLSILSKTEPSEVETVVHVTFDKVIASVATSPTILTPILKSLLTGSGNIAFDKVTGSTIIQRLIAISDTETVKLVGELYLDALMGTEVSSTNQPSSKERAFAAHQLAKLMSHPKVHGEKEWKVKMMCHIFTVTLFYIKKPVLMIKTLPKPFSREARVELKPVFLKSLDVKDSSLESLSDILFGVAELTSKLLAKPASAEPISPVDAGSLKAWKDMMAAVAKIREKETKRKEDVVFQLLFIHLGFQLFSDPEMAIDVLSDLHICYDKSKGQKKKKRKSVSAEEEPEWIEVVVDLLLSLLSQNKHVLRQVVGSVMTILSPHVNDSALQAIIDVIHPPKSETDENGDETMIDVDESSDEDYETEEEEDVEEEEEEDTSESEEEESESEDEEQLDDEFRERVMVAMGKHAGSADSDQDSIDIDDLDEEDMATMDEALSNIFRSICKKKPAGIRKKEMMDSLALMHFKIRSLDMIDIYLSHNPKLSHVMYIVQPIIAALETAVKQKDLQNRLMTTLKKITNLKKLSIDSSVSKETFSQMVQSLVNWGNSSSPVFAMLCQPIALFSQCCNLVLKYAEKFEEQNSQDTEVMAIYNKTLADFFNKSHCPIPMSFFLTPITSGCKGVLQWADLLSENAFATDTRPFRRTQAVSLLAALLKSPALSDPANKKSVNVLLSNLVKKLSVELTNCAKDGSAIKPRFFCELLNLARALHSARPATIAHLKEPIEAMRDVIPTNRYFKDVKNAFNKVGKAFGINFVTQKDKKKIQTTISNDDSNLEKSKLTNGDAASAELGDIANVYGDNVNGNNDKKRKKKKKKNSSNEALKKKKERKMFELEGQFEGQEMPSFAGILLNDNMNFAATNGEAQPEQTEKVKKSKKRKPKVGEEIPVKKAKKDKKHSEEEKPKKKKKSSV